MAQTKLLLIVLFCLVQNAFSFWTSCAVGRPPIRVTSPDCDATRCVLTRGDPLTMNIEMDFLEAHPQLITRVTMLVLGIWINIPNIPEYENICQFLYSDGVLVGCPTAPGRVYEWRMNLNIPTTVPSVNNGRIRLEAMDGSNIATCFEILGTLF
ncbi:uncharacterized protein [Chironomus tepperi]|uniref:uncharacterized protein n=1 Tax=Chironomus tepperi TaxID=113505 RepID=UPI00391EF943